MFFKVPNHTSDQHDWFLLSANRTEGYEDYYVWRDCRDNGDGTRRMPNNWVSLKLSPTFFADNILAD